MFLLLIPYGPRMVLWSYKCVPKFALVLFPVMVFPFFGVEKISVINILFKSPCYLSYTGWYIKTRKVVRFLYFCLTNLYFLGNLVNNPMNITHKFELIRGVSTVFDTDNGTVDIANGGS